jgi:hypothetical protein
MGISLQALYEVYRLADHYGMTALAVKATEELNRFYGEMPVK